MALQALTVKVYSATAELFEKLYSESDCTTKGKFLELLLENYQNPQTKTVVQDTEETTEKLSSAIFQRDELRKINENLHIELETAKNYVTAVQTIQERQSKHLPYYHICKRDKTAEDIYDYFDLLLSCLQDGGAFILTEEDKVYLQTLKDE
jgi:hypothetical protein